MCVRFSVGQCCVINRRIKFVQQAKLWRGHGPPNIPPEKGRFGQFWTYKSDDEISTLIYYVYGVYYSNTFTKKTRRRFLNFALVLELQSGKVDKRGDIF